MNFARKRLAIACLPLVALQWPVLAHAQAAPEVQDTTQGASSEVVVTGEVARNRTDIELKRNHTNAYDSLSVDDIQALPDISVADAFRRIPGVTGIVNAFSSDFDSGVTNQLTARGLSGSYNLVAFDGLLLATAGGASYGSSGSSTSRDVGLGNFPSTSVKRIEVVSSFSADINGEASGAYFNVVSGSAYDSRKPSFLRVAGTVGHNGPNRVPAFNNPDATRNGISDNANFTAGTRFGSSQQFGIIATGVFNERRWDTETFLRDANSLVVYDGVSVANPAQIRPNVYSNYQKQYGGTLKLEFQPSSNFYSNVYGLYYRKDQHTVRNANVLTAITNFTNTSADDGTWGKATASVYYIDQPIQYSNSLIAWHTNWKPADRHEFDLDAGWSTATQDQHYAQLTYSTVSSTSLAGAFEQEPESFSYSLDNPLFLLTPGNYKNTAYYKTDTHNVGVTKMAKLDYGFNQGSRDFGFGYKVGASFIDMLRKNSLDEFDYTATGTGQLIGNAQTLIMDPQHVGGSPYGALYIDPNAVINSRSWVGKEAADNLAGDWRFHEYDAAGFAMVTWKSPTLRANAGLRYEHTVQTAQNYDTTTYVPSSHSGRYDAWLPSATLLYDPVQGLRLRASYSKTLGRPTPGEVSLPGAIKTTNIDGDQTITGGNPDLQPRRVSNFDIGAEYYWDRGDSLASITLFQKNITDDIFMTSVPVVIDDVTYTYTTPHNADKSGVRGVIAQITKNHFDFLPGPLKNFGGLLNGTLTDAFTKWHSGATVVRFDNMVGQSKWAGNATLFYQLKNILQARVSYNYRSNYVYAYSTNGFYVSPYGQLDAGVRYNLKRNIILSADARNLTHSRYQRTYTNYPRLNQDTNYGQTFSLGVTARFN